MLGDQRAVEPLLKRLLEDHEPDAAQALLEIGGQRALEALYRVIISPSYPGYVRHGVARAYQTQALSVPDILLDRLQATETPEERRETMTIFALAEDARAFPPLLIITNNPQEDVPTRYCALRSLRSVGGDQAIAPLLTLLASDPSRILRASAALHLSREQPEVTTALCAALHDEAAIVRACAASSLAFNEDPQVIPALEAMIEREATLKVDLQDYEHDRQIFSEVCNSLPFVSPPEECAQNSINSIHQWCK